MLNKEPLAIETEKGIVFFRQSNGYYSDAPEQFEEQSLMHYRSFSDLEANERFIELDLDEAMDMFSEENKISAY